MLKRLKEVMEYYSLTPSRLADAIGVPRSSISHLLTGRNKPSLDFVLKLIKTYPEINLYWLLNGKGSFPSKAVEASTTKTLPFPDEKNEPKIIEEESLLTKPTSGRNQGLDKPIKKIVFFFEDGTFETYSPN